MTNRSLREEFAVQLGAIVEEAELAEGVREDEPSKTPRARGLKRTAQLSKKESFERLDLFLEEAQAGAPDEWLARQAGTAEDVVLWWRKENGIKRKRGPVRANEQKVWAAGFGLGYDPQMHAVASDLKGAWEAPEYVLRTPLTYSQFCRHVHALHALLGTGPELLGEAFGVRARDAELALAAWGRHLRELNVRCATCKNLVDPRYGVFCSIRCKEMAR